MSRRKRGPPYDLFGEIPVTWPEVWAWVQSIGFDPHSWRGQYYAQHWNVIGKIRAEKLRASRF